ncbi:MAG: hypothetical protein R3C44_14130 [Chloroflexota bacterium]
MESWLAVHRHWSTGNCAVTREHCQRSNGGLYFTGYDEFAATMNFLLDNPETADRMGRQGAALRSNITHGMSSSPVTERCLTRCCPHEP